MPGSSASGSGGPIKDAAGEGPPMSDAFCNAIMLGKRASVVRDNLDGYTLCLLRAKKYESFRVSSCRGAAFLANTLWMREVSWLTFWSPASLPECSTGLVGTVRKSCCQRDPISAPAWRGRQCSVMSKLESRAACPVLPRLMWRHFRRPYCRLKGHAFG